MDNRGSAEAGQLSHKYRGWMIFLALSLIITVPFSFIIPFGDISLYKVVVGYITLMVIFGIMGVYLHYAMVLGALGYGIYLFRKDRRPGFLIAVIVLSAANLFSDAASQTFAYFLASQ